MKGGTMADERWFTVSEVADILKVHEETVRQWLRAGRLEGVSLSRRAGWRVAESDLNRFLGRDAEGKAAA
jgi:excisionase family DNA binding protein